jgi:hypothetical protein
MLNIWDGIYIAESTLVESIREDQSSEVTTVKDNKYSFEVEVTKDKE